MLNPWQHAPCSARFNTPHDQPNATHSVLNSMQHTHAQPDATHLMLNPMQRTPRSTRYNAPRAQLDATLPILNSVQHTPPPTRCSTPHAPLGTARLSSQQSRSGHCNLMDPSSATAVRGAPRTAVSHTAAPSHLAPHSQLGTTHPMLSSVQHTP